jgi:nucleoside-diphosphate-sugar epimerase
VWSFGHVDDAVGATVAALERGDPGVFHVVDDDPAPVSRWLPELARTLGAPAPRRVPRWLGLLAVGGVGVSVMTEVRGAANAKARRELAWTASRPSWRGGFAELADAAVRAPAPAGTS